MKVEVVVERSVQMEQPWFDRQVSFAHFIFMFYDSIMPFPQILVPPSQCIIRQDMT